MVLLYLQLPKTLRTPRAVVWKGKTTVTFSEMITCVRRVLAAQWFFHTRADRQAFSKLSRSLQDTILYALAPVASWVWQWRLRRSLLTPMPDTRAKVELRHLDRGIVASPGELLLRGSANSNHSRIDDIPIRDAA